MSVSTQLEAINAKIVKGDVIRAHKEVRALLQKRIPTSLRARAANLARRVDLPFLGIRLLNSLVRPSNSRTHKATPEEIAEYGACLTFLGASVEALELLKTVSPKTCPESLLFRAFAYFSQWDYEAAIPLLKAYIKSSKISPYSRSVGKVNLLAAFVNERHFEEAETLQREVSEECRRMEYQRLLGNSYELAAYNYLNQRKSAATLKTLAEAEKLFSSNASLDSFYVRKWKTFLDFTQNPGSESSVAALHAIRTEAQQRKLWETVRECDGCEAVSGRSEPLLRHVYFGTPYPRFRARLLKDFGQVDVGSEFSLVMRRGSHVPTLDLVTGTLVGVTRGPQKMKLGQLPHRLLGILLSDFYRPLRVAVAHHELFPDEYFDPSSSPHRVHEAFRRLRAELVKKHVPLSIVQKDGFYRAVAMKPLAVALPGTGPARGPERGFYSLILSRWGEAEFSMRDCMEALKLSKSSTIRALNSLAESGMVVRKWQSAATRYRLLIDKQN